MERLGVVLDGPLCPADISPASGGNPIKWCLMKKAEFIDSVKTGRGEWAELLSMVDADLMLEPGQEGEWSAKDILAHVMWYEREMLGMLKTRALVGSDLWELRLDERNAAVHDELKEMTLNEVREEADRVFTALIEQLELLPEEAYSDSGCFKHMPSEWKPWDVMAGNTFRHYAEHTESIRRLTEI